VGFRKTVIRLLSGISMTQRTIMKLHAAQLLQSVVVISSQEERKAIQRTRLHLS